MLVERTQHLNAEHAPGNVQVKIGRAGKNILYFFEYQKSYFCFQGKGFLDGSLLDPTGENLWHRKQHSVVNIGQIDHLGRYKSAFEQPPLPAPDLDSMPCNGIRDALSIVVTNVRRKKNMKRKEKKSAFSFHFLTFKTVYGTICCHREKGEKREAKGVQGEQ